MNKNMGLAVGASLFALIAIAAAWKHYLIPAIVCGVVAMGLALPLFRQRTPDA